MLDVELFATDAGKHHLVGVALHAANAVLLLLVLRWMTGATWRPALVAALFAVHPLRVESIAWASERKDLLAGLFWMTTLAAYAWYARRPGVGRYLTVVLSLGLGLMAKPMLVTLPFVLLLLDCWPLRRWSLLGIDGERSQPRPVKPGRLLLEKLPLLALAAGSSAVTILAQGAGAAISTTDAVPLGLRAVNACASYGRYLWKTLWPANLAYFYPHPAGSPDAGSGFWLTAAISVVALVGISYLILRDRSRPQLAVGWLWFLGTLVPVLGLFQVGAQAWADRYAYLPLIGIYIALAWGLAELAARWPGRSVAIHAGVALVVTLLAIVAAKQAATWRNSRTLFEHAVEVTRNNHVARTHLGTVLNVAGDLPGAEAHYRAALAIEPDYADAHSALGIVFGKRGDLSRAASHFERAVQAAPQHPDGHYNLGLVLRSRGDLDGAERLFREAIRLRPGFAKAWSGLGQLQEARGDPAGAIEHHRRALAINPAHEPSRRALDRLGSR